MFISSHICGVIICHVHLLVWNFTHNKSMISWCCLVVHAANVFALNCSNLNLNNVQSLP